MQRDTIQPGAEIEVTPEMAAAGAEEIWGNPSMIDGDQCNELAVQVYRRMERIRLTGHKSESGDIAPAARRAFVQRLATDLGQDAMRGA